MRNLELPGRSPVMSTNGMAATSHPLSTQVAIDVIKAGGNALDGAIAACAVQCVVEPGSTGIAGDCFALYVPGGEGEVIGLNGSGWAPQALTSDYLLEKGIDTIGVTSPHAVTVPGAIDAWDTLLKDHGTMGLDKVLQHAINYAENGWAVTQRVALDWSRAADKLNATDSAKAQYTRDGVTPQAGEIWKLPKLAATMTPSVY